MAIGAKILDLWLDKNLGPNWPKCSYNATDPWMKIDFDIWRVHQIHVLVLDKMRLCFWKLQQGFWVYGLVSALSPICPKLVCWMQATGWRFIFTFDNFTGFSSWFRIKRGLFLSKMEPWFWIFDLLSLSGQISRN